MGRANRRPGNRLPAMPTRGTSLTGRLTGRLAGLIQQRLGRLGLRLLASYLLLILVGTVMLVATAEWMAPTAFHRHLQQMTEAGGPVPEHLARDLYRNFRAAVHESMFMAVSVSAAAALLISLFISRRVVEPVRTLGAATGRIAAGHYSERVAVPGDDELGDLARHFNQMAATLEQTEERRRQLLADIAHELRTPLASIQGYMEGLADGVFPPDPSTYELVHREAARLQRLVRDLAEVSRVEAGQVSVHPQPTPPSALIEAATARLRPQFEDKGVQLLTPAGPTAPELPPVAADPDRIVQVLINLLGNALHYTPSGGRVQVWAEPAAGGTMVRFVVTDTGIGIPPEHLPHIFDRFYRVDKSRSRVGGGSGIGLTIARHLVEAHGGEIQAHSPGPGRGATFSFTLPRARP